MNALNWRPDMLQTGQKQDITPNKTRLYTTIARNESEVAEAQRLRYKVFAEEMGAEVQGPEGLDVDEYDTFCEHLLVRESDTHQVVGTYRILSPQNAVKAGGYYSANEFDLNRISHLFGQTVEVGRACVHKDHRNGGTITMLWAGLAKYMLQNGYEYMIGCGSVSMADGGHAAASLYKKIAEKYSSPAEYRVFPHNPVPLTSLNSELETEVPPLIKGYLRLGAYIWCGATRANRR